LVPAAGLPADKELWARLDVRTVEPKELVSATADSGISIPALIQLLSRPPRPQQDHWTLESAAFHLADLKQ
jgi:P pilus assembly chaperone PapD